MIVAAVLPADTCRASQLDIMDTAWVIQGHRVFCLGCLKQASNSVQVLLDGLEAVRALNLINLK